MNCPGSSLPKVSIIIVTYNASNTLQRCLDSVFKQEYPNLELVIIDGESNDNTVEIIKANKEKIHFWTSEKDEGIYDAMNKGLEKITGEWVYFLGADDQLLDGFSSLAFELKSKDSIYYGSVLKEGFKYLGKLNAYKHAKFTINHQAIIYPVSVFQKYKYDCSFVISADHVLNMRCWKDKDYKFEFKDYIIANFNHTGVSAKKDKLFAKQKSKLILENYGVWIWVRFQFKTLKSSFRKG